MTSIGRLWPVKGPEVNRNPRSQSGYALTIKGTRCPKATNSSNVLVQKETSPVGHFYEGIRRHNCGPTRRDRTQCLLSIMEIHTVLAPVVAMRDQPELVTFQWVKPLSGPIRLVDYDPHWPRKFEDEAVRRA